MGQTRTQAPKQDSSIEEEVAWFVGGIIAGTIIVPNPTLAIAQALVNLVPAFLPPTLRADISAQVARLVLTDPPTPSSGSGALSAANRENLKYRVAYGFAAIKRLVKAVQGPGDEIGERLDKALKVEQGYFKAHRAAEAKRSEGFNIRDSMVALHGETLSWHHGPRTRTDRLHHVKAEGKNFMAMKIPIATGALPGVLPGCNCFFGPPIQGAEVMK